MGVSLVLVGSNGSGSVSLRSSDLDNIYVWFGFFGERTTECGLYAFDQLKKIE